MYKPKNGKRINTDIWKGDPAPWPKSGSSDIVIRHLSREMFLAVNEPWHGNEIVRYRKQVSGRNREVSDNTLVDGHTVVTSGFDVDERDEIVADMRRAPQRVYLHSHEGEKWNRSTLGEGIAAAICDTAYLNADGRPNIVCIGMGIRNL
jgi:hypothetical protein